MKFTVEPEPFIRMVEMVGEAQGQKRADAVLRLVACQGRVCLERNQTTAEMEAVVREDGQCTLPQAHFLRAVKTYRDEVNLTIEADGHGLRVGEFALPVSNYRPYAVAPLKFQVFLATALGFVPSKFDTTSGSWRSASNQAVGFRDREEVALPFSVVSR